MRVLYYDIKVFGWHFAVLLPLYCIIYALLIRLEKRKMKTVLKRRGRREAAKFRANMHGIACSAREKLHENCRLFHNFLFLFNLSHFQCDVSKWIKNLSIDFSASTPSWPCLALIHHKFINLICFCRITLHSTASTLQFFAFLQFSSANFSRFYVIKNH